MGLSHGVAWEPGSWRLPCDYRHLPLQLLLRRAPPLFRQEFSALQGLGEWASRLHGVSDECSVGIQRVVMFHFDA